MRVLIIGGTRFIGPHVARELVRAGADVTLFHRGHTEQHIPTVVHVHGNRREIGQYIGVLRSLQPDVILDMIPYNAWEVMVVQDAFRGYAKRLVVVSSCDVYLAYSRLWKIENGPPIANPLNEGSPLRSVLYLRREEADGVEDWRYWYDKIPAEQVALSDPELPGTILRLAATYGPNDPQHRLFEYVKRMDDARPAILLDEAAMNWRWARTYVENAAHGIALAAMNERANGKIYNLAEPDALPEAEWVHQIGDIIGWQGQVVGLFADKLPEHLKTSLAFEQQYAVDTNQIRSDLKYAELITREEALTRTVGWERLNPPAYAGQPCFDYAAEDLALGSSDKQA